jgi:superfamily II DNA helicase RecQ
MSFFKAIGRLFGGEKAKQPDPVKSKQPDSVKAKQPNSVKAKPIDKTKSTSSGNKTKHNSQVSKANASLVTELNKYRMSIARREGIKPYMVFTDSQLNAIIEAKPLNERELSWIDGFDDNKVSKYGKEIIKIFKYAK